MEHNTKSGIFVYVAAVSFSRFSLFQFKVQKTNKSDKNCQQNNTSEINK